MKGLDQHILIRSMHEKDSYTLCVSVSVSSKVLAMRIIADAEAMKRVNMIKVGKHRIRIVHV